MNDAQVRDMVISHDKVLDSLSDNIRALTGVTSTTNTKLDKVVDELAKQNVLMERVNNMDRELTGSFDRVNHRLDKIEEAKEGEGCNAAKFLRGTVGGHSTQLTAIDGKLDMIDDELPKKVSYFFVQWFMVLVAGYLVMFGVYTVKSLHILDNKDARLDTHAKHAKEERKELEKRIRENEDSYKTTGLFVEGDK